MTSLDYSYDLLLIITPGGAGVGYALGLVQRGKTFIATFGDVAGSSSWTTVSHTGLTSASFSEALNSGTYPYLNSALHPDFSAGGSNIQFGYAVQNSFQFSAGPITGTSGIDNLNISGTAATPEPGTFSIAGGIAVSLAAGRRRAAIGR